jgi:hypothetical protein
VEAYCIDVETGQPVNFKTMKSKVQIFLPQDNQQSVEKAASSSSINLYTRCQFFDVEKAQFSSSGCERI